MIIHTFVAYFLNNADKKLKSQDNYPKKLFSLGIESSKTSQDPQKVIFNYLYHALTEREKSLLCKGQYFVIPSDKLECSDFLLLFELLYCGIQNLDSKDQKKKLLKFRIKDSALSSLNSYNKNSASLNLTIVIRNGKIVWKYGPNRPFFLYNLSSENC